MTLHDALVTIRQFKLWIESLSTLDYARTAQSVETIESMLSYSTGWSRARLEDAFASIGDALAHAELVEPEGTLKDSVDRLGADVRTLRDSKAQVEAEVISLHDEAQRLQATIDERRGEVTRIKTELDDIRRLVSTL